MRKRFTVVLAANGFWPDADTAIGFRFNWVKLDNVGGTPVDFGFTPFRVFGDNQVHWLTCSQGKVRVFNVAGPRNADGSIPEDWPDQIWLLSQGGTTVQVEVADHPIVDMTFAT